MLFDSDFVIVSCILHSYLFSIADCRIDVCWCIFFLFLDWISHILSRNFVNIICFLFYFLFLFPLFSPFSLSFSLLFCPSLNPCSIYYIIIQMNFCGSKAVIIAIIFSRPSKYFYWKWPSLSCKRKKSREIGGNKKSLLKWMFELMVIRSESISWQKNSQRQKRAECINSIKI